MIVTAACGQTQRRRRRSRRAGRGGPLTAANHPPVDPGPQRDLASGRQVGVDRVAGSQLSREPRHCLLRRRRGPWGGGVAGRGGGRRACVRVPHVHVHEHERMDVAGTMVSRPARADTLVRWPIAMPNRCPSHMHKHRCLHACARMHMHTRARTCTRYKQTDRRPLLTSMASGGLEEAAAVAPSPCVRCVRLGVVARPPPDRAAAWWW